MELVKNVTSVNRTGSECNCLHYYTDSTGLRATFTRMRGGQFVLRAYRLDLEQAVRLSDLVRNMATRSKRLLMQAFADGWTVSSTWLRPDDDTARGVE